jgi:hypothetical protein
VSEIADIKTALQDVIAEAHSGQLERGRAAVLAQLYGVLLRSVEIERKLREQEEIEERLRALEAAHKAKRGGTRWG